MTSTTSVLALRGLARPSLKKIFSTTATSPLTFAGFKLQDSFFLEELQLNVFSFKHEATNAEYIHLDTDDTNNAFCIGFRTPAPSSCGVTHVLEHLSLCGSEKMPVKDPFFHMTRRSFATFMNAMTGADYTLYPFSTTNEKDFSNLLSVYMDAVFCPLLRHSDFLQEAHRLEEATTEGGDDESNHSKKLKFNGVVFNEMRGVVSDPARHFYQQLRKNLLPSTHYEFISGGDPISIVDMQHQDVLDYHKKCYQPENAITMTYGDMNPLENGTMEMLNQYFIQRTNKRHERNNNNNNNNFEGLVDIPRVTKFPIASGVAANNNILRLTGPASMAGDVSSQTRAAIGFTIPPPSSSSTAASRFSSTRLEQTQQVMRNAFEHSLINELLLNGPAAKMYKALISEGLLGSRYCTGSGFQSASLSTPICAFGVESLRPGVEPEKVFETVLNTIEDVVSQGSFGDPRRTEAAIFRQELSLRHRSTQRGISLLTSAISMSLVRSLDDQHDGDANNNNQNKTKNQTIDPCHVLDSLFHLREVSKDQSRLITELRRCTIDNMDNSIRLVVEADKSFITQKQNDIEEKCNVRVSKMSQKEIQEYIETMTTWKSSREVESKQSSDLAEKYLPSMKKSDISKNGVPDPKFNQIANGVFVSSETPTNGVVYVQALLPLSGRMREIFSKVLSNHHNNNDNDNDDESGKNLKEIFYWAEAHSYITTLGTSFADAEELDTLENLSSLGFSFSTNTSTVWKNYSPNETTTTNTSTATSRLGTHISFRTTHEKLNDAMQLLGKIIKQPNVLSSSSTTSPSWEKSHKRFVTRLASSSGGVVSGATQRGNALAFSAAKCGLIHSKFYPEHLISDQVGGMRHLGAFKILREETANQVKQEGWNKGESTPKIDFSNSANNANNMIAFAKKRDEFIQELPSSFERGVWWCCCENGKEQEIVDAIKNSGLLLPSATTRDNDNMLNLSNADESNMTEFFKSRGFDLDIIASSTSPRTDTESPSTTKIIEFPTDTSFAAFARANDSVASSPMHPHATSINVASQILKSEFFHTEVREKGGAYGAFCSSSSEDGTTSCVSYRDPQPVRSLEEVFKKSGSWLRNKQEDEKNQNNKINNVNEKSVEQALLRVFAGLDAPRTPASFGNRLFFHSITEEMRQKRRDSFLGTRVEDVRDVASQYFGQEESDVNSKNCSSVIIQPEGKKKDKK